MTPRNRSRLKALSMLLAALLLGGLLGALAMGAYVKHRLAAVADFGRAERLTARIEAFIAPRDEAQRQAIRPVLERTGRESAERVRRLRQDLTRIFDEMERDLAPHLSDTQRRRLAERRDALQRRSR